MFRFFLFLSFLLNVSFASAIVNVIPVNGSHVYDKYLSFHAVNVPVGQPVIIRFSNFTESVIFDTDVSKLLDQTGNLRLQVNMNAIASHIPGESDIYWQIISGSGAIITKGDRWFVRLTNILVPFSLVSPADYSDGKSVMSFSWEEQAGVEWYELHFSTSDGWTYVQNVGNMKSFTINTEQKGFPKNKTISWRVKAFRDGGLNNLWSREWWNFVIRSTTSVDDLKQDLQIISSLDMVKIISPHPVKEIELYSLNGNLVRSFTPNSSDFSFSVGDILNGIYFVKISFGESFLIRKVLVQH